MFKRDIIIITLIIAMFFAISSVCAVDSEIQDIGTHNSTGTVSVADDDNLEMNDADELPETGDFDDLNQTINGDPSKTYIELEKDYLGYDDEGFGIKINRENVVIDGKGHTIDCTGENSRMFYISANNITLKNIVFTGGRSANYGGAVYTYEYLKVINCTFIDNQATGLGSEHGGGAIFAYSAKIGIYNCTFMNNHASKDGGAIAARGSVPYDYEIFNCTFINNAADRYGGAFYSDKQNNMGEIINSTFIGNQAEYASAICNYGDYGTVDRCVFANNTGNSAIYGPYATMTVNNSIIVNNGDNPVQIQTPTIDNNWWGTIADDKQGPVVDGDTLTNYYILNMTADDDSVDITLNNLYNNGVITTSYDKYALPSINFTVKARNIEVGDSVVLGANGEATINHAPVVAYEITIEYNGVGLTREVKPSFKWLKDQINAEGNEVSLVYDYIYDSTKDYILTNGIEFEKDMTIDGQGHIIDAKGLSNIFYFDDDTNSHSLTLKNIVFANAVGNNGAAVYFKGNKIDIINCTFINNKADSQGDAVYVANALSNSNRIIESVFTENEGTNSVIYLNIDSNANLKLDNSIFLNNNAAKNIKGTGNVTAEYNWWGNTLENNEDISKTEGVNVTNWLFLKVDAVPAKTGDATLSLNNVYDHGEISTYSEYALYPITFYLGGSNVTVSVPTITLGDNGQASYQFRMDKFSATLTASYDDVTTTTPLKFDFVDDGSFNALNEIILFCNDGDVIELTHDYVYCDNDTITEGIVIPRKITINGNGHTIDAKGKTRIFMIPEHVSHVTINNVSFINAKASNGSVIVIAHYSDYINLLNCNFTDNSATDYGGVIDCVGDYCTIENCNFINNRAVSKAGVIRYYHDNNATIKNSNFINNRVADGSNGGGVIYVDDNGGAVDIDKSTFINNVANDRPGAVLYTPKSATITNSIFLNNQGSYIIYGGSGVELTNNWFGNTSIDYNSFADGNKTVSGVYYQTTLNNWLYLDIKFLGDYTIISLNNAYVKSSGSTGVISDYNLPKIILNVNSTTLNLTADKITLESNGRARVYYNNASEDAKLTVSNEYVSLTKDVVSGDFNILQELINENDEIELSRDYSYNNVDSIKEGISINKNITIDGNGHTIDARGMTRIFNLQASNATFKNIIFANGRTNNDNGGAICIKSDGGSYNFENCTFLNNNAYRKGGAIYINTKNAQFNLYDSSFKGNKAAYDGALYVETDSTEITIDKCLFTENEARSMDTYQINGNAIIWNSKNDNGNNVIKNSIFLNNGYDRSNMQYTFLLKGGNVNIDYNFWGTYSQTPQDFSHRFVGDYFAPNNWLFLNYNISSKTLGYNETATIKYFIQAHNGIQASDFDYTKLPDISFDVSCDKGKLDKNTVSLNEEFTYMATDAGVAKILNCFNDYDHEISITGPYMAPIIGDELILYAGQGTSKNELVKTANGNYGRVTVTCNDSSIINLYGADEDYEITAKATNGTAKLTFLYDGYYAEHPSVQELDIIVKVVKVPLNISVTNIEGNEITLNVYDTLDLNIAFEIDEIHKDYASPYGTMDVKYDSSIISFSRYSGFKPENGSFYPTGYISAISGGTTYLTLYSTSGKFAYENYTIKITVNRILPSITLGDKDLFKVDANSRSPTFSIKLDKNATGTFTVNVDNGRIVRTAVLKGGSASITVANLAVGAHKVTISYSGDDKYAPITKSTTFTIKEPAKAKKATKIVAKKKTFKAKTKVKKYTITLKSGKTLLKEVKVTLKIKGKKYNVKTNKKGKATFKIKKLMKKGRYTAFIKFAGNKNYKATSKKVRITVKK